MSALLILAPVTALAGPQAVEENKALAEQCFSAVFGRGDMEVSNTILAANFQRVDRSQSGVTLGKVRPALMICRANSAAAAPENSGFYIASL